jgi:integrase
VALGHAEEEKVIAQNPGAGRRVRLRLKDEHREMAYLSRDEIAAYLAAAERAYWPLAMFLLGTGARIGEAVAVQWGDIDLAGRAVIIRRVQKKGGVVGSTKSDKERRVAIGETLAIMLADRRARAGEHVDDLAGELVFTNRSGRAFRPKGVSTTWHKKTLATAGITKPVRLHDLRHSAAAAWIKAGLPLVFVQAQLGHASIQTTLRHYGHLDEGFMQEAAAKADAAVFRARS